MIHEENEFNAFVLDESNDPDNEHAPENLDPDMKIFNTDEL